MSIEFGFFNSVDGDRKYTADQITKYLKGLISNGILASVSDAFQVQPKNTPDMSVSVKPGKAWIDGYWVVSDADINIDISTVESLLNRIDRIVLRLDHTNRKMEVAIIKGTAASSPVAPVLTRTAEVYELCLAEIKIVSGQTSITASSITDTRPNNNLCGWVTSLITNFPTTTLFNQYQAALEEFTTEKQEDFDNWFADLQTSLSTVVMLRKYTNVIVNKTANRTIIPINIAQYDPAIDILELYINGFIMNEDIDYTKEAKQITLTNALSGNNDRITVSVYKNVNGEEATTVQAEVEVLQNEMSNLMKYNYFATGTSDNIAINNIIQSFYDGTGEFAGIDETASLELKVYGKLGITSVDYNNHKAIFVADKTNAPNKRCTLDFSCVSKIEHSESVALTGIAMSGVIIKGLNMNIVSNGSAVGANGTYVLENAILGVKGLTAYGLYGSGDLLGCSVESIADSGTSYAVEITSGVCRIERGTYGAYRKNGSTSNAAAIHQSVADTYLLCSGTNLHNWAKTGYETLYALNLQEGKHSVNGSIRALANLITSGATGSINGEINISGS